MLLYDNLCLKIVVLSVYSKSIHIDPKAYFKGSQVVSNINSHMVL